MSTATPTLPAGVTRLHVPSPRTAAYGRAAQRGEAARSGEWTIWAQHARRQSRQRAACQVAA